MDKLSYIVPASKKNYIPDYRLPNNVILEAKGKLDRDARKKMALIKEQHPDADIRILFMRDNPITKGSKTRYSDWAKAHGFIYAVSEKGVVPDGWLVSSKSDD